MAEETSTKLTSKASISARRERHHYAHPAIAPEPTYLFGSRADRILRARKRRREFCRRSPNRRRGCGQQALATLTLQRDHDEPPPRGDTLRRHELRDVSHCTSPFTPLLASRPGTSCLHAGACRRRCRYSRKGQGFPDVSCVLPAARGWQDAADLNARELARSFKVYYARDLERVPPLSRRCHRRPTHETDRSRALSRQDLHVAVGCATE